MCLIEPFVFHENQNLWDFGSIDLCETQDNVDPVDQAIFRSLALFLSIIIFFPILSILVTHVHACNVYTGSTRTREENDLG